MNCLIYTKIPISILGQISPSGYYLVMLDDWIERTDRLTRAENEFADLIESAYLAGIITGETQTLAYIWLANNYQGVH